MKFLGWLCLFLIDAIMVVMLFICFIFMLAVFDYVWDTDIKETIRVKYGQSEVLKHLREKTTKVMDKLDSEQSWKERY